MGRKKPPAPAKQERSFELEEEFDLAALGFEVGPAQPAAAQCDSDLTDEPSKAQLTLSVPDGKGAAVPTSTIGAGGIQSGVSKERDFGAEAAQTEKVTEQKAGACEGTSKSDTLPGQGALKNGVQGEPEVVDVSISDTVIPGAGVGTAAVAADISATTGLMTGPMVGSVVERSLAGGEELPVVLDLLINGKDSLSSAPITATPGPEIGSGVAGGAAEVKERPVDPEAIVPDPAQGKSVRIAEIAMSRTASATSGVMTGTDTLSTLQSVTSRVEKARGKPRTYKARLVLDRRPGRKVHRLAIHITRRPPPTHNQVNGLGNSRRPSQPRTPPPPPPPSDLTKDFAAAFSRETLDQLNANAKAYNTSGHLLPLVLRDFLPSIVDRQNAVQIANEVRQHLHLPLLSSRTDRVALQKALARMRERLYVELYAGLCLPLAPKPIEKQDEAEEVERPSLSLTSSSLHHLIVNIPYYFPQDRTGVKAVFQKGLEYGEAGDVVWKAGVGHMARGKPGSGIGYRGELGEGEGGVHVFVDYSNILHGLLHALYSDPRPLPPRHARILSLPCLSLLLTRGRHTAPGAMHLVASSPLHQKMDALVRLGWEVSVMKRVEIYEAEVMDYGAGKLVPKATKGVVEGPGGRHEGEARDGHKKANGGAVEMKGDKVMVEERQQQEKPREVGYNEGHPSKVKISRGDTNGLEPKVEETKAMRSVLGANGATMATTPTPEASAPKSTLLPPAPPPPGPAPGLRRYKEQGVDEILTLKLLQTIYARDIDTATAPALTDVSHNVLPNGSSPTSAKRTKTIGTIVLATGDARGGQFNAGGFLGAVRHAIKRGWAVELWSFTSGMSRAWRETAKREGWDGRFRICAMDEWKEWLVDVNEELAE